MQYSYSSLYKADSAGEVGTLKFFRERYGRSNVNPSKVLDSYEGSEQFLVSVGKAYVIEAAMEFFGMENINDYPQYNNFVANISHKSNEVKKKILIASSGSLSISTYLLVAKPKQQGNTNRYHNGQPEVLLIMVILCAKKTKNKKSCHQRQYQRKKMTTS